MSALWLVLAVVAATPEPVKLAAPGFFTVQMPEDVGRFYSEHFAEQMRAAGFEVTTAQQISTLLGFERQKALMACSDASCVAELANALGVDALITGQLGKFGPSYQVNVNVISARDGQTIASHSGRVKAEDAVLEELERAAREMAPEVARKLGKGAPSKVPDAPKVAAAEPKASTLTPSVAVGGSTAIATPRPAAPSGSLRSWALPTAIGGGVALAVAGGFAAHASVIVRELNNATETTPLLIRDALDKKRAGQRSELIALSSGILGVAALGTAAGFQFLTPAPARVAIVPVDGGAAVSLSGRIP
jgi:hypothetical protein